jgi:putative redox protein
MSTPNARATWIDGLRFAARTSSGRGLLLDSGVREDGTGGTGPMPADLLPVALAGCTGMDVISILQKMQQPVTRFEVEVSFERAGEHPRPFTSFTVTYHLDGDGLDAAKVDRACALSRDRYCSVAATLEPAAPMRHLIVLNGADPVPVSEPARD